MQNRLEIYLGGNSLGIKDAFELFFKTTDYGFTKYRIYKKLAQLGYKLTKNNFRKELLDKHKRKIDHNDTIQSIKYPKRSDTLETDNSLKSPATNKTKELEYIENIFKVLNNFAPRNVFKFEERSSDYTIINPNNSLKNKSHTQLVIW